MNAKVYIIGRTYQTGIERKIRSKGTQGSSISQIADFFFQRQEELDQLMLGLHKLSEPLAATSITGILETHGQFVKLLSELTIDGQSPRSFVAKYMHFHNPVVPLYDRIVGEVLPRLAPLGSTSGPRVPIPNNADSWYAGYVLQFLGLFDLIALENPEVTVRTLDYCLLWKRERGGSMKTMAVLLAVFCSVLTPARALGQSDPVAEKDIFDLVQLARPAVSSYEATLAKGELLIPVDAENLVEGRHSAAMARLILDRIEADPEKFFGPGGFSLIVNLGRVRFFANDCESVAGMIVAKNLAGFLSGTHSTSERLQASELAQSRIALATDCIEAGKQLTVVLLMAQDRYSRWLDRTRGCSGSKR